MARQNGIGLQIKYLVNYQREVDKSKLTAVANFEKLMLPVLALSLRCDEGLSFSKFAMAVNLHFSTSRFSFAQRRSTKVSLETNYFIQIK